MNIGASKVYFAVSMSLDGYIAPEGMDLEHSHDPDYKDWARNWSALQDCIAYVGAWLVGRRHPTGFGWTNGVFAALLTRIVLGIRQDQLAPAAPVLVSAWRGQEVRACFPRYPWPEGACVVSPPTGATSRSHGVEAGRVDREGSSLRPAGSTRGPRPLRTEARHVLPTVIGGFVCPHVRWMSDVRSRHPASLAPSLLD
jgi:hypothetical protein